MAQTLVPLLLDFLGDVEGSRALALDMHRGWSFAMAADLPAPLVHAVWMRELQQALTRDERGEIAEAIQHPNPLFIKRVLRDTGAASVWYDGIGTSDIESCR